MTTTTSPNQDDHPLSPTLKDHARKDHVTATTATTTSTIRDPLSPQLGQDDEEQEEEEKDDYNRINSHSIRDISISTASSYSSSNLYADLENGNPSSSSSSNSKSTPRNNLDSSNGKSKGWIAGTASTERLTTTTRDPDIPPYNLQPKQRQMSTTSSVDGSSAYSGPQSNSGSDEEEKNVQANLERWAAEEKQRRKAARSSRTSSMLAPPGSSLARRLSHLGRKPSTSKSSHHNSSSLSSNLPSHLDHNGNDALLRRSSRTESVSSIETNSSNGGLQNGNGLHSNHYNGRGPESTGLEDVPEAESSDAATERGFSQSKRKGKARALDRDQGIDGDSDEWNPSNSPAREKNDPFRDPNSKIKRSSNDDIYSKSNSYHHHTPIKPTATRPIVTVGRAPSISARNRNLNNPSIVQTDHDAERSSPLDPFDENQPPRAASSGKGFNDSNNRRRNRIILEGDENEELRAEAEELELSKTRSNSSNSTIVGVSSSSSTSKNPNRSNTANSVDSISSQQQPRPISSMAPPRKSTSSSRFNELDISDVEEGDHGDSLDHYTDGPSADQWTREERKRRLQQQRSRSRNEEEINESERERERLNRTWWTDWICGCGPRVDEDEEQAGKTMPDL